LPDCHVCGQPLAAETAICNNCERPFHFRTREDSDGPDCGEAWISEQHLSLEFACNSCLGKQTTPEPPIGHNH
jgi:hypothetical protein